MILVCGEALVDLFLEPARGGEMAARAVAGGSPFNVAIGLRRLGSASGFLGGLSGDAFGTLLTGMLEKEGVDLSRAVRSDRLSTISVVATDANGSATYAFHGEGKADREITPSDIPPALPDDIRALTFGSYTLAVDPVGQSYLSLARREKGRRVISLDPNVRPTVTPDLNEWHRRYAPFLSCATLVKASDEDIRIAYGEAVEIGEICRGWLAHGPAMVIVTRGPDGATAFSRHGEISVPGRAVKVVDTVGAGDTFHAALLSRLQHHDMLDHTDITRLSRATIEDVMRYAVVASSITCSRRGADLPRAEEVAAAL